MSEAMVGEISSRYKHVHDAALKQVEDLTEEQMRHQLNASAPSIAFHLWHMGRYADSVDRHLNGSGLEEMWDRDGLARRWGFDSEVLGARGTGTGMETDALAALTWPPKSDLETYARQSFESAEKAVTALTSERLQDPATRGGTIAFVVLLHLSHESRHLGMIECLRGVLANDGTATT